MANAPSTYRAEFGDVGSGLGAEAIAANLLVNVNAAGTIRLNGADEIPAGCSQEGFASGAQVTYYKLRKGDKARLKGADGALAAGDFFKGAASGLIAPDGTSGATTYKGDTSVGRVLEVETTVGGVGYYYCLIV